MKKQSMPATKGQRLLWFKAVTILVLVVYPLSYAPVYRLAHGPDRSDGFHFRQQWQAAYIPLEYIVDCKSPARELLLKWAEVWNVYSSMRSDSIQRDLGLHSMEFPP